MRHPLPNFLSVYQYSWFIQCLRGPQLHFFLKCWLLFLSRIQYTPNESDALLANYFYFMHRQTSESQCSSFSLDSESCFLHWLRIADGSLGSIWTNSSYYRSWQMPRNELCSPILFPASLGRFFLPSQHTCKVCRFWHRCSSLIDKHSFCRALGANYSAELGNRRFSTIDECLCTSRATVYWFVILNYLGPCLL